MEDHLNLLIREEPLREELASYVTKGPLGSPMIKHPLVISIFQDLKRCGWVNKSYEHKLKLRQEYLHDPDCKLENYIFIHERPFRVQAFMEYMYTSPMALTDKLTAERYWTAVRHTWIDTENSFENYTQWSKIFKSDRFGEREKWLMDDDERLALSMLPDLIPVFRGYARDDAMYGWSWTLKEETATWFAKRFARDPDDCRVSEGRVKKSDVLALLLGRGEQEILSEAVTIIDTWFVD